MGRNAGTDGIRGGAAGASAGNGERWSGARLLVVALAVAVSVLSGCGGADDGEVTTVGTDTTLPATLPSTSAPDQATPTSDPTPSSLLSDAAAQLEDARRRWADAGVQDHSIVAQDDCGDCDPSAATASRSVVWGRTMYASGEPTTVDGVFARIEQAIAEDREVEATYDPALGYPTEVWIDRADPEADGGIHIVLDVDEGLPGDTVSLDRFQQARSQWTAAGVSHYEYTLTTGCNRCPYEGRLWVEVTDGRVTDQRWESFDGDEQLSGQTVDKLFDDLGDMFAANGGLVADGVRFSGTAEYDLEFGYPNWIGLDIEIVERTEWNENLPPRLVFMIDRFRIRQPTPPPAPDPRESAEYCAALDSLFTLEPEGEGDPVYLQQLDEVLDLAPVEDSGVWALVRTLVSRPFDYDNFNPAADALDDMAERLDERCPDLGLWVVNDSGYVVYYR